MIYSKIFEIFESNEQLINVVLNFFDCKSVEECDERFEFEVLQHDMGDIMVYE